MKILVKVNIILFILLLQTQVLAKPVKMAGFFLDPFMMVDADSKQSFGVTIDYWKEFIAPEMEVDLEVVGLFPILRALQMLRSGEVDVVSQLTKIPEREAEFLYPETAITSIISCIVVRNDSPLQVVDKSEDLHGMTIGYIYAGYIPEMLKHEKIHLDLVTATDFRNINYKKLMAKRVDALLDINYVSLKYWLASKGYLDTVRFIMLPVRPLEVYSIFRDTKEGTALRDAFNVANKKGISEKVFEKISRKYIEQ